MNLKRFCSFVLCICYLSLSVASLTWADTASSSNADYDVMSLNEPIVMAASELSPLYSVNAQNQWTQLPYDNSLNYVWVPSDCTRLCWIAPSGTRHLRLRVDSSDLGKFGSVVYYPDDADGSSSSVWDYFSNYLDDDGIFYMGNFNPKSSPVYFFVNTSSSFMIGVNQYVDSSLFLDIGGIYDNSDAKFKLKTVKIDGVSLYPKSFARTSNRWLNYFFTGGGILKKGYEYSFTFYNSFGPSCLSGLHLQTNLTDICKGVSDGNYVTFTFTPTRDLNTSDLVFYVDKGIGKENLQGVFYYISSSSSYIPASDTGQQGQTTAANTTIIKNVVSNISNTVSNISNQITNTTNTITNTITNTTNQIKEAVSQSANQISQTVTNTSNQIKDSVNQSAEKISQTVTNKVNEVNGTINSVGKETQKKIDDMQKAVVDKLEDTKKGIITGIIDGLKSLFIPSDDFFKKWFDDMYSFFDERLGFLMLPVDLLVNLIDIVVSADSSNAGIPFPEIQWEGTVLIPAQTVKIEIFNTEFGKDLQDKLYFVGNVIMIGALLSLMYRKFEEVLRS